MRDNQSISHPPSISNLAIAHDTCLRFTASSAVSALSITFQNLLDLILMASSATAVYDMFLYVRIRRVSVWAVPVIGNASTVSVDFSGGSGGAVGDGALRTDTSMGIEPAHVAAKPRLRTQVAQFQPSSVDSAFTLTCPTGSVVDVELTFRGLPSSAVLAQNVAVGATTGAWYFRGLDGKAAATTVLPAVLNGI